MDGVYSKGLCQMKNLFTVLAVTFAILAAAGTVEAKSERPAAEKAARKACWDKYKIPHRWGKNKTTPEQWSALSDCLAAKGYYI